jgi:DNA-binding MarR family transcriptional regulator
MSRRHLTPETRFTQPGFLLHTVGFVARRWITEALAPVGLNGREAEILLRLRAVGPLSQQQLLEHLSADPSNLVSMLNRLEREGLLKRDRDTADRRRHIVSLTPAGAARRDLADAAVAAAEERLLSGLSAAERTTLQRLLLKVDERTGPAWADPE